MVTGSVVKPDSTSFPSFSQDTVIGFGVKFVASQMSLDLRGAGPEKPSRGGTNTFTLGFISATAGMKGQGVSSAWPKPHPLLPLGHAWAWAPLLGGFGSYLEWAHADLCFCLRSGFCIPGIHLNLQGCSWETATPARWLGTCPLSSVLGRF